MKNILFDLDGTLTDPKEGIVNSIRFALEKLNKPIPELSELIGFIGPPLVDSFLKLFGEEKIEEAKEAVALYRTYFKATGLYENRVYPGMIDLLKALNEKGYHLFVATSKPHVFANKIIEYFLLSPYFNYVYGSELSGERGEKEDLIQYLLGCENLAPPETLMVGDRKYDVTGAHKNGIQCIGVSYGYGFDGELESAGVDAIAASPNDILNIIQSLR